MDIFVRRSHIRLAILSMCARLSMCASNQSSYAMKTRSSWNPWINEYKFLYGEYCVRLYHAVFLVIRLMVPRRKTHESLSCESRLFFGSVTQNLRPLTGRVLKPWERLSLRIFGGGRNRSDKIGARTISYCVCAQKMR